jgi:hypothetical protein
VRRPEMPQVQLDAVSTLVDQLRAAHTAPTWQSGWRMGESKSCLVLFHSIFNVLLQ